MNARQRYRNRINAARLMMEVEMDERWNVRLAQMENTIEYRQQDAEAQGTSNHDLTPDQRMDMKGMI